jgi:hypothetical protein
VLIGNRTGLLELTFVSQRAFTCARKQPRLKADTSLLFPRTAMLNNLANETKWLGGKPFM